VSLGTRRNGSNKVGPFNWPADDHETDSWLLARRGRDHEYTGRHASPRRKTARARAGKVVPAAAAAATLAAGAAAYILAGGGSSQASQPNAAMARPGAASASDIGKAHKSASTMINAVTTARASAARASATRSSAPAAGHTAGHTAKATTSAPAATSHTATATPAATSHAASALSCDLNYSMLPENVTAIVSFLLAHGYSHNAAAGIAGNIYQESKGDPESVGMGGGGLIGWTPLHAGMVTGNPAADLQTQLAALLDYNQGWSSYLPSLNSAASPASAAYIYVTDFERAGIPAASTREASAANVASACGI
jgi:Phage tail lysozyme